MTTTIALAAGDQTRRTELETLLTAHGYEVTLTTTGGELLRLLRLSPPGLALLDAALPDMSGLEVCRQLHPEAAARPVPVIVLGADDVAAALAAGAADALPEGFTGAELLARLRPHLELLQLQRRLDSQEAVFKTLTTRLHSELAVARGIQQGLLPPSSPNWPGLEVVCFTQSAREVGGDFYTYHTFDTRLQLTEKRYAIAVGDVSGKGMPAALLMAISLASFKNLSTQVYSLNKLVTDLVTETYSLGNFLTDLDKAIAFYTATTRQNCALVYVELIKPTNPALPPRLRAVNAGCITPIIRPSDGAVQWLDVGGMPLGAGLGAQFGYHEETRQLSPGDLVILTSDGVVEANNSRDHMLGFDGLEAMVAAGPQSSARAMLDHLKNQVTAFVGDTEPHDDMTIVVIQV